MILFLAEMESHLLQICTLYIYIYIYIVNHWSFQIKRELHLESEYDVFKTLWQINKKGQNFK
jgi:hypothetical protein